MNQSLKKNNTVKLFVIIAFSLLHCVFSSIAFASDDFLPPEVAFKVMGQRISANQVQIKFIAEEGYYLYKDKFKFKPTNANIKIDQINYPAGKVKFDENFQKEVETYHGTGVITLQTKASEVSHYQLEVETQGCADKGLCYPPQTSLLTITSNVGPGYESPAAEQNQNIGHGLSDLWAARQNAVQLGQLLQGMPITLLVIGFLILGISLSLTPCVLPMVPILSSIIAGEVAHEDKPHPFFLALSYVLGMAVVYTSAGVMMAKLGGSVAATLQSPWILAVFALVLVVMSLSMFGMFELQMPQKFQSALHSWSQKHEGGRYFGVSMMGAISALMVGPCITAPLAGVLGVIAQTGSTKLGGILLFSMAMGMGIPLLLVGAGLGHWLPKTGPWMERVKHLFGGMLIALALWLVSPFLPTWVVDILWAVLSLVAALMLGLVRVLKPSKQVWESATKLISVLMVVIAGGFVWHAIQQVQLNSSIGGAQSNNTVTPPLNWHVVHSELELDNLLAQTHQPALLDFYADWCVSCKEMEKLTFSQPEVIAELSQLNLIRIDVTRNTNDDKAMLQRFHLFGPPGIIFFDSNGRELDKKRVIGFQDTATFVTSLKK